MRFTNEYRILKDEGLRYFATAAHLILHYILKLNNNSSSKNKRNHNRDHGLDMV